MTFLYNNWKKEAVFDSNILPSTAIARLLVSEPCKELYLSKQSEPSKEKVVLVRGSSN
jgi:hypothetical protein